jgi:ADP-ribose pyrophosphatase YjhB (NUDIX family)
MKPDDETCAKVVGLVEGEGSILVKKGKEITVPPTYIKHGETVYDAIRRGVNEWCGLEVIEILDRKDTFVQGDKLGIAFLPFCVCYTINSSDISLVFVCRARGEPTTGEWIKLGELKEILENEPERISPTISGALKLYVEK